MLLCVLQCNAKHSHRCMRACVFFIVFSRCDRLALLLLLLHNFRLSKEDSPSPPFTSHHMRSQERLSPHHRVASPMAGHALSSIRARLQGPQIGAHDEGAQDHGARQVCAGSHLLPRRLSSYSPLRLSPAALPSPSLSHLPPGPSPPLPTSRLLAVRFSSSSLPPPMCR